MLKKTNVDTIFYTQHIEISKFHFISTHNQFNNFTTAYKLINKTLQTILSLINLVEIVFY